MEHLVPFPALLERLRDGDATAVAEFFRRYEPFLRRMARRWLTPSLRRHADSEDVAHSVFRVALGGLADASFATEGKFLSWLATIARHRVARVGRRERGPRGASIASLDESLVGGGWLSPLEIAEHAETLHRLKSTLDRLPPSEREVVLLRDFEELSFAEIAERLGRPTAEAAQQLHARARRRLLGWLDERPRDPPARDPQGAAEPPPASS